MKYFEKTDPYILVKARDEEKLAQVVATQISDDFLKYPETFDFHEVTEEYALNKFSRTRDVDDNPISKADAAADFYSDREFVLSVGKELI